MRKSILVSIFFALLSMQLSAAPTGETKAEENSKSYLSPIQGAVEIIYLPSSYPAYQWSNFVTNDARVNGFRVGFEWIPFGDIPYGKPVIGLGTGLSWISDLALTPNASGKLYAIPVEPYIGYRLDYFADQILVPYGKIGLGYAYLQEEIKVTDGTRYYHTSYLGLDLSVGAEFWLNFIDRRSARSLDASTGINNVYVLAEYYKSRDLGAKYANLSREEIRLGMRFEF